MRRRFTLTLLLLTLFGPLRAFAQPAAASVDSMAGRSGKLLARLISPVHGGPVRVLQELFGDSVARRPGVYPASLAGRQMSLITMVPFGAKVGGRLGKYWMGLWPGERRGGAVPEGFIEVTRDNAETQLSPHFTLKQFLTHDQADVWPKYLVLKETLIDKLELVVEDLQTRGVRARRVAVLSGFRTPQYNRQGVGKGRASDSRHQYGDAADIYVDNDGNGVMDDLNGDGRVDLRDTRVILESVERVERRHPELAGGAGLYPSTSSHGPFVHIDVRGARVRWGL